MFKLRFERWIYLIMLEEKGREEVDYLIIGYVNGFDFL